jgi:peptidoglycan hydrolase CwlO-like protein
MNEQIVTIVLALIGVLGGAGFWNWLQKKAQLAHDEIQSEKADRNEFRETLKTQVDRLADQVNELVKEKEGLLREMADLRAELSAAQRTIMHLEETLRNR